MSGGRLPSVSVVVPTYREAENLPALVRRIGAVRVSSGLDLDLWIVDDDSRDGTAEIVRELGLAWINLVVRVNERGLCGAVLEGMRRSRNEVIVVMDADLSHPPEIVPSLVRSIADGYDFAIGSRYVAGGSTDPDLGLMRRLNSVVATWLARPLTAARDPMSGFFAIERARYEKAARTLNPIGYKIGLELIVRCRCTRVAEIPIAFGRRRFGRSKLTLAEQLRYLQHLRRLVIYRYPNWASVLQFAAVGASGTLVNLAVAKSLSLTGVADRAAIGAGIGVSVVSNFLLNRRFTFSHAMDGPLVRQFVGFVAASSIGMIVNYAVAVTMRTRIGYPLALAVCAGILAGMSFNFAINRWFVFRRARRPIP